MVAEEVDPLAARRSVVSAYNRALDEHRRRVAEHPRAVERWQAEHEAWRRQEAALVADVAARRAELEQALARWQARRAAPVEQVEPARVEVVPVEDPRPAARTWPVEPVNGWVPRQPAALGWPAPQARTPGVTAHPLRAGGTGWPDALVTAGRAGPAT